MKTSQRQSHYTSLVSCKPTFWCQRFFILSSLSLIFQLINQTAFYYAHGQVPHGLMASQQTFVKSIVTLSEVSKRDQTMITQRFLIKLIKACHFDTQYNNSIQDTAHTTAQAQRIYDIVTSLHVLCRFYGGQGSN